MRSTRFFKEKIDGFKLVQQREFDKSTGLPRWGCYPLCLMAAPQFALRTALDLLEVKRIWDKLCDAGWIYWKDDKLWVKDSQQVMRVTADRMAAGALYVKHVGDEKESWGDHDYQMRLYRTSRGGPHYVLEDATGWKIYDPGLWLQVRHRTQHYLKFACRPIGGSR
jgi:hypothetical protein